MPHSSRVVSLFDCHCRLYGGYWCHVWRGRVRRQSRHVACRNAGPPGAVSASHMPPPASRWPRCRRRRLASSQCAFCLKCAARNVFSGAARRLSAQVTSGGLSRTHPSGQAARASASPPPQNAHAASFNLPLPPALRLTLDALTQCASRWKHSCVLTVHVVLVGDNVREISRSRSAGDEKTTDPLWRLLIARGTGTGQGPH